MSFFSFYIAKPDTLKVAWTWCFTTDLKSPNYVLDKKLNWLERIRNIQMNKAKICLYDDVLTGLQICNWAFHMVNSQRTAKKWIKTKNTCEGVQNSLVLQTELRNADFWSPHYRLCVIYSMTAESLSKHDDDSNKNPTNLHIWQGKTVFLHALHVHFSSIWHFEDVLVLSTTWNDLFCRRVDNVSIWWQMFNFVFLSLKHA